MEVLTEPMLRKTRRGNIIQSIRERYLRTDISSGHAADPDSAIQILTAQNVITFDLGTILKDIDIIEHHKDAINPTNTLFLQSVL